MSRCARGSARASAWPGRPMLKDAQGFITVCPRPLCVPVTEHVALLTISVTCVCVTVCVLLQVCLCFPASLCPRVGAHQAFPRCVTACVFHLLRVYICVFLGAGSMACVLGTLVISVLVFLCAFLYSERVCLRLPGVCGPAQARLIRLVRGEPACLRPWAVLCGERVLSARGVPAPV